jgi:hypothetical protein
MSLIWKYYISILRRLRIPLFSRPINIKPHNRITGDTFLKTELDLELFAGVFILAFSATFICAWNFHFPTPTERIIWRSASVYNLIFGTCAGAYTWVWHLFLFNRHKKTAASSEAEERNVGLHQQEAKGMFGKVEQLAGELRNASPDKDPNLAVPIRLIMPVTFFCVFYCLFRAYILVEDLISLRSLPESAFATIEWSKYIPHL